MCDMYMLDEGFYLENVFTIGARRDLKRKVISFVETPNPGNVHSNGGGLPERGRDGGSSFRRSISSSGHHPISVEAV